MSDRDDLANTLLNCPFCGHRLQTQDPLDTIYPLPVGKLPNSWRVVCQTSAGGCGAEAHGTSPEEAAEKWNQRKQDPLTALMVTQNVELREALDWVGASCVKSVLAPGHYLISQVELDSAMKAADGPWPSLPGTVLRVTGRVWQRSVASSGVPGGEWVLDLRATSSDVFVECRHTEPITTPITDVIGLPSLYPQEPADGGNAP
jgi:hypothetical protein